MSRWISDTKNERRKTNNAGVVALIPDSFFVKRFSV
jgi:hypothetical protein